MENFESKLKMSDVFDFENCWGYDGLEMAQALADGFIKGAKEIDCTHSKCASNSSMTIQTTFRMTLTTSLTSLAICQTSTKLTTFCCSRQSNITFQKKRPIF